MAATIRRAMKQIEPARSVFATVPLADLLYQSSSENRLRTVLLTHRSAHKKRCGIHSSPPPLSRSLPSASYGTLSYLVSVRRREVGLRLALGAVPDQILYRFLMQGLRVAAIGCLAGLLLAAAFSRLLEGMLYGISRIDLATYGIVAGMVLLVAAAASVIPAARAARLDPMRVLREE